MPDGYRRGLWEGSVRRRRFPSPLAPRSPSLCSGSGISQGGLLLLGGLLVGLLALLLKDFVRESILVPLAYTVSGARVVLNVLPQLVWWVAFLLVTLFIVVGAVLAALPAPQRSDAPDEARRGRVETWMRWIDLAAGGGDHYTQQVLARRVRDLTLGVLAARDAPTRAEAWPAKSPTEGSGERSRRVESRLRSHALPAPPCSPEGGPVAQAQVSEIDIEHIVRYLEDELEIPRGG